MRLFVYLFIILFCSSHSYGQKKISPKKLQADFDYLVKDLRAKHQGLYQYIDKKEVDQQIQDLRDLTKTPMTKLEFYGLVRKLLHLTNEGHTYANLPNMAMVKVGLSKGFLPLAIKFCDKKLIITQNFGENIPELKKGTELLSINGRNIAEIKQDLFPLMPTDGFNETSKYEWLVGFNLSLLHRLVYGKSKHFDLEIRDYKSATIKKISIPAIRYTQYKNKNAKLPSKKFDFYDFNLKILNDSIAYLCVPNFKSSAADYETFYRDKFTTIDSLNIKHLILDMQGNTGGTEGNENLLYSYLSDSVIQKYRKVTMPPESYEADKEDEDIIFDKWALKKEFAERGEFTLFSNYYSDLGYAPPAKDLIYTGKLYVLISGLTFSGGAEFASLIKMTNRGIFIGEETGGVYEGNVSGYAETTTLPHTKIKVDIPTVHFQINVAPEERGRGVLPDYVVPQTHEAYMEGRNAKLDFVMREIMKVNQ